MRFVFHVFRPAGILPIGKVGNDDVEVEQVLTQAR